MYARLAIKTLIELFLRSQYLVFKPLRKSTYLGPYRGCDSMDCTVVSLSWKFPYGKGLLSVLPKALSVKSEFRFCLKNDKNVLILITKPYQTRDLCFCHDSHARRPDRILICYILSCTCCCWVHCCNHSKIVNFITTTILEFSILFYLQMVLRARESNKN